MKESSLDAVIRRKDDHAGRMAVCAYLLSKKIEASRDKLVQALHRLLPLFNDMCAEMNSHMQYVEVNLAGLRKLLKRHDKRTPSIYHSRRTPCIKFHKLLTPAFLKMHAALEVGENLLLNLASRLGISARNLTKLKPFQLETTMVLQVKAELKKVRPLSPLFPDVNEKLMEAASAQPPAAHHSSAQNFSGVSEGQKVRR